MQGLVTPPELCWSVTSKLPGGTYALVLCSTHIFKLKQSLSSDKNESGPYNLWTAINTEVWNVK